jgi:membrane-associated phospholipid phosphatase
MEALFGPQAIVAVQRTFGPDWLPFFLAIDALGDIPGMLAVYGALFWLRGRRDAYALLLAQLLSGTVVFALMQLLAVPRPADPQITVYRHIPLGSFPSGHVATATVLWGTLAVHGLVPAPAAVAVVMVVAASRLYLGAHHLADVLAAPVVAGSALAVALRLWPAARERLARLPFGAYVAAGLIAVVGVVLAYPLLRQTPNGAATAGAIAGGALALLLEYRALRFRPSPAPALQRAAGVALGLMVLAGLVSLGHLGGAASGPEWALTALAFGGAALWAAWLMPAALCRLGLGERGAETRRGRERATSRAGAALIRKETERNAGEWAAS